MRKGILMLALIAFVPVVAIGNPVEGLDFGVLPSFGIGIEITDPQLCGEAIECFN